MDAHADEAGTEPSGHPSPFEYVMVALALSVVTLVEVAIFYITAIPKGVLVALLLGMGAFKFAVVVLWFMHLRFDSPLFRRVFVGGLILAITLYLIVLATFGSLRVLWVILVSLGLIGLGVVSMLRMERRRGRPVAVDPGRHG